MATTAAELAYQHWRQDYRSYCERRDVFQRDVMHVANAAFDAAVAEVGDSLNLPTLSAHARRRRATLASKFCMVLWSAGVDEAVFRKYTEDADRDRTSEDALSLLRYKATQFRPRIGKLTAYLDRAGFFTLMLWPNGQEGPSEPCVLKPPEGRIDLVPPARIDKWFFLFTGFVELAQAIVVEGNYGSGDGLRIELDHIESLGLSPRILFFDNNHELYRSGDGHRWPLERIGEAVAFAAEMNVEGG